MEPTLEPCVQLPPQCSGPCITLAPRRAVSGFAHVGMETGPYPFHHEEGKRGSGPGVVRGPQGPIKDSWSPGAAQSCSPPRTRTEAGAGRVSRARVTSWRPSLWVLLPRDPTGDYFPRNVVFKL